MKQATRTIQRMYMWRSQNYIFTIFFMIGFFLTPQTSLLAQENQKETAVATAKPRNNVEYYLAVYFDYKPGKTGEAFKIIEKYFIPVDKEAERFVIQFRPITGSWDEIAYFPLEIGPEALSYSLSPSDALWNSTFVKQAGSQKEVDEIWEKFQLLVQRKKTELVIKPLVYK